MIISPVWIAPMAFDPGAVIAVDIPGPGSDLDGVARRVAKVGTLDVDVTVIDGGYADADRTFRLLIEAVPESIVRTAQRMIDLHPELRLSKVDGVWLCVPDQLQVADGIMTFTIQAKAKLTNG